MEWPHETAPLALRCAGAGGTGVPSHSSLSRRAGQCSRDSTGHERGSAWPISRSWQDAVGVPVRWWADPGRVAELGSHHRHFPFAAILLLVVRFFAAVFLLAVQPQKYTFGFYEDKS
jgi:hypothetical protein